MKLEGWFNRYCQVQSPDVKLENISLLPRENTVGYKTRAELMLLDFLYIEQSKIPGP